MAKSQSILRYILRGIPAIVVAVLLSACSTTNTAKNMHSETYAVGNGDNSPLQALQNEFENMVRNIDAKSHTTDQYVDWKDVHYRPGGSTKKGIDCSSFVQRTLHEQFGLEPPCPIYEQQETGKSASCTNLCIDDLALFHAGSTDRHVGTYTGNNQFIHALINGGAIISSTNEPYWKKCYNEAHRVLSRSQSRLAAIPRLS